MESVVLVIHLLLALAIIGLVMVQRSEGGGLGIGGGSGGLGKLSTAGGTASFLTRATAICAGCFFVTSLVLGILAGTHGGRSGILEHTAPAAVTPVESPAPAADTKAAEEKPAEKKN